MSKVRATQRLKIKGFKLPRLRVYRDFSGDYRVYQGERMIVWFCVGHFEPIMGDLDMVSGESRSLLSLKILSLPGKPLPRVQLRKLFGEYPLWLGRLEGLYALYHKGKRWASLSDFDLLLDITGHQQLDDGVVIPARIELELGPVRKKNAYEYRD